MQRFSTYKLYPYGMLMPGKHEQENTYEYGFSGMRKDDEIKGQSGTSYDFGARMYDPRVGRWLSRDPLESTYPHQSPYAFVNNNPLIYRDPTGKSGIITITEGKGGNPGTVKVSMDVTIYGSGATAALASSLETDISKLLADNIKTVMVNGEKYNVEFDVNITAATYESAHNSARGAFKGSSGNEDYKQNFVRIEQVNQKQCDDKSNDETYGSRDGYVSEWGELGDNSGFFITGAMSDPTVALHECFHGLLLLHDDMIKDGTAPSAITPTNTPSEEFPNISPKNMIFNEELNKNVIKPTSRIPRTEELLRILDKAGYTLSDDGKGIKDVIFTDGQNTINVGKISNNIYSKDGATNNQFNPQDKDPAKED